MASVHQLAVVVLLTCCVTTTLAHNNSTIQQGNDTASPESVKAVNRMSNSTNCTCLEIDKSKLEEILHLQHQPTKNVIEIKISIISEKQTRYFHFTWAGEIGRTIISLVWHAEDTIFNSILFTGLLEVGTTEVEMKLNVADGCLPAGNSGTKEIFEILLRELFLHSKDTHFFKLCRIHDDGSIPFNCCRIIGDENLTICADYSSFVVTLALPAVIFMFLVSSLLVLPFLLERIVRYPSNDSGFHKASESHMSLASMFSMIFFEGRGPVKSLFRRSVFAGLSLLVFCPTGFFGFYCLLVTFWTWFAVFVVTDDVQMTSEECNDCKNKKRCSRTQWGKNVISSFKLPFFIPFNWLKDKDSGNPEHCKFPWCKRSECCKKECCNDSPWTSFFWKLLFCPVSSFLYGFLCCLLIILYCPVYLGLMVLCLIKFSVIDLIISFVLPHPCSCSGSCKAYPWEKIVLIPLRLATILNVFFVTGMFLLLPLFLVVGMTLNAESCNPFVAPILSFVLYFWKNWKLTVEGRYLQLKTSIIEFCKEKASGDEDIRELKGNPESEPDHSNSWYDFLGPSCGCCKAEDHPKEDKELVKVPKEPAIKDIKPTTTSLQVTWNKLTADDLNGQITKYEVEYRSSKTVHGISVTTVDLTGLKPATMYAVTVNAVTSAGDVKRGDVKWAMTNESDEQSSNGSSNKASDCEGTSSGTQERAKGLTITSIKPKKTSLQVTWKKLTADDLNGQVTKYEVCYQSCETVDDASITMVELTGLRPATTYDVRVRAFTTTGNERVGDYTLSKTKEPGIKFDEHGEAMIAKNLYNEIAKKILPLDRLLIFFSGKILFAFIYAFAFFLVMTLGRDSGMSESVQVISAIAGALIPFIFDIIFADHHLTQRNANNMAMNDKLSHILRAKRFGNIITVEIINLNSSVDFQKPQADSQNNIV